jgi:hypothetical protein
MWSKLPQTLSKTLSRKSGRVSHLPSTWRHIHASDATINGSLSVSGTYKITTDRKIKHLRSIIQKSWVLSTWGSTCPPAPCDAIVLPGRKVGFRAGFRPDSSREILKIGPPAGLWPTGGPILRFSLLGSGRNPARKPDFGPEALLHNRGYRPRSPSRAGT